MAKPKAAEASPPVVDANGEMLVPLDADYVIRPSYKAIKTIERRLRPLLDLANDAARGMLTVEEMAVITCEMMKAYGAANPEGPGSANYTGASADRLEELIYEAGGPKICARLMVVLSAALNGGYTASGEAKAAKGMTT